MKYRQQKNFETLSDMNLYHSLQERHIDGLDSRSDLESFKKNQFRKSSAWKWFCRHLIEKRGGVCERCGGNGHDCSGIQVHHLDPKNYEDMAESKFKCLCGRCHLTIEAYSATEESRKRCPKADRQFITLYPYRELDKDVLAKSSGQYIIRKWTKELKERKAPGTYINVKPMSDAKMKQVKDAAEFMKQHSELFK